jgi:hypothetical protein
MKEYMTDAKPAPSIATTERLLLFVVLATAMTAVTYLATYAMTLAEREKEEQLSHLIEAVKAGASYEVDIERQQLDAFAPFAKAGFIVAPEDSAGMHPALFCLSGADGGMSTLVGDWDGLKIDEDSFVFMQEQALVERCAAVLG